MLILEANGNRSTDTELSRLYVLRSGKVLQVDIGSRDPALYRLESQKQLASDLGRWERIVAAIGSVMYVKPEESES